MKKLPNFSLVFLVTLTFCLSLFSSETWGVVITNYSFEDPEIEGVQSGITPPGWVSMNSGVVQAGNTVVRRPASPLTNQHGDQFLSIFVDGQGSTDPAPNPGARFLDSLDDFGVYQANTVYTLTVAMAQSSATSGRNAGIALMNTTDDVTANSNIFNSSALSTTFQDFVVTVDTSLNPELVGKGIGIRLIHEIVTYPFGREVYFDNVRLDVIPEPGTGLLLGLAGGSLLFLRRRRRG